MWFFKSIFSPNADDGFIGPIKPDYNPNIDYKELLDSQGVNTPEGVLEVYHKKQDEDNGKNPFLAKIEFYFIAILGLWAYSSYKK